MKPVLLGMCNPYSDDPRMALYPHPPYGTGGRILEMIRSVDPHVDDLDYLAGFDRRNLIPGRRWDKLEAYRTGPKVREQLEGRTVVVFGREVWNALGLVGAHSETWIFLPHPSGANRWYNEPRNRVQAGTLLSGLLRGKS